MKFLSNRWDKISKKGKTFHMYLGASLYRQLPLVIFILLLMEIVNGYRHLSEIYVIRNFAAKIMISYIIGVFIGHLEWNFLEKLFDNRFKNNIEFRIEYIFTYGICFFGTAILSGEINPYFMSMRRIIYNLLGYGLMALFWGVLMSYTISKDILKDQGQ